jgi:hypothetical protein
MLGLEVATPYLEGTLLESSFEVVRLAGESELVQVEMIRSANQRAVRQLLRVAEPGIRISLDAEECVGIQAYTAKPSLRTSSDAVIAVAV